jgi:hypothetical protein
MKFNPLKDLKTGWVDSTQDVISSWQKAGKGDAKGWANDSISSAKKFFDPGGVFFGKNKKGSDPGAADRARGIDEFFQAIKDFEEKGNNQYSWLGDLQNTNLGDTEMNGIKLDPKLKGYEMQALADLEQISKDGLSMRDQADLARLEGQVNRQNAGRTGAIQQSMAARGMGGSGLELVAQMQANQDATERQALASLEKAAMAQDGRRNATAQLGSQAGQMSARDFAQQAQRAQAQDAINRFNVANQNSTNSANWQGRQGLANQNVNQNNSFQQSILDAKQDGAKMRHNIGTEASNRYEANKAKQGNFMQGAMTGMSAGSNFGPWGAAIGAGAGGLSTQHKEYYEGGQVPGQAKVPGDHPANDTVPAMLSPGEVVVPRTVAEQIPGEDPVEAIVKLLKGRPYGKFQR